jgi:hypothetical protein
MRVDHRDVVGVGMSDDPGVHEPSSASSHLVLPLLLPRLLTLLPSLLVSHRVPEIRARKRSNRVWSSAAWSLMNLWCTPGYLDVMGHVELR